jgi:hypothetical protein
MHTKEQQIMKNNTEIVAKLLSFLGNLSTPKLTLVLIFGILITITLNPEVLEITLNALNKSVVTSKAS